MFYGCLILTLPPLDSLDQSALQRLELGLKRHHLGFGCYLIDQGVSQHLELGLERRGLDPINISIGIRPSSALQWSFLMKELGIIRLLQLRAAVFGELVRRSISGSSASGHRHLPGNPFHDSHGRSTRVSPK